MIDYDNEAIMELADTLLKKVNNKFDFIKTAYEFVRDNISHSADINEDIITCVASEVLKAGHGIVLPNRTCWQLYYAANLFQQVFAIKS